jgi:isochorismate synthase
MTPDIRKRLDASIEENRSFAAYRIPGDNFIRFVAQEKGPADLLRGIDQLNGQRGFVIAPFAVSESCPLVLLRPDREECIPAPADADLACTAGQPLSPTGIEAGYADRFHTFITPLREQRFSKLVLSRQRLVSRAEGFSPAKAFCEACSRYPRSYTFLFHTPQTGSWIGCSPELLLAGDKNQWHTVALAGTQWLNQCALPRAWDDKNRTEQRLVADYVRTQLLAFGIQPEEKGPCAVRAGELMHLKTDFYFNLPDTGRLGELLKCLHPTPAVSGLPQEEACRFIRANEGYERRYYSGFTGWLDPEAKTNLYVSLRCMNMQAHALRLYAGGGLLPSSVMEDEWQETENKLQTIWCVIRSQTQANPTMSKK